MRPNGCARPSPRRPPRCADWRADRGVPDASPRESADLGWPEPGDRSFVLQDVVTSRYSEARNSTLAYKVAVAVLGAMGPVVVTLLVECNPCPRAPKQHLNQRQSRPRIPRRAAQSPPGARHLP